jgi:hypothetical protein
LSFCQNSTHWALDFFETLVQRESTSAAGTESSSLATDSRFDKGRVRAA